jgi:hypothetical protein
MTGRADRSATGESSSTFRRCGESPSILELEPQRSKGAARQMTYLRQRRCTGLAAVTGAIGGIGMAGFTLAGGYGPLSPLYGLGLDNLLAAEVVLAD